MPARGRDCREVPDVSALAAQGTGAAPGVRRTRGYVIYGTAGGFGGQGLADRGRDQPGRAAVGRADRAGRPSAGQPPSRPAVAQPVPDRPDRPAGLHRRGTGNNDYLARGGRYSHHTCRYGGRRGKPCYHATRGYDMASGLGTPQASYLVTALLREHSNAGLG